MLSAQAFLDLVGSACAKRFKRKVLPFVDLFSGSGGTSEGALKALKELGLNSQLAAVNHWKRAIDTHALNHTEHLHFCTGVDRIDIDDLLAESDSDGLFGLWGSPSCIHFSTARGGAPINDQDRSSCWAMIKWLRKKKVIHCWVENVREFVDYGPLKQKVDKQGYPLFLRKNDKGVWKETRCPDGLRIAEMPAKRWWKEVETKHGLKPAMIADRRFKGKYFQKWVHAIRRLGYDFEYRILNAADFGAPTKRHRFIAQAVRRNVGRKIVWPNPTHAEPNEHGRVPAGMRRWKTARSILDLDDIGTSIFTRKKPLAPKTIDRISVGILRYGFDESIVKLKGTGTANSADAPIGTIQASGLHYGRAKAVQMLIPQHRGRRDEVRVLSVNGPMPTITGSGADAVARAEFIVPNFGERPTQLPRTHNIDEPVPAVTSHGAGGIVRVNPVLFELNHGNGHEGDRANNRRVKSLDQPLGSLTGSRGLGLASPQAQAVAHESEAPTEITDWRSLSATIQRGIERAKIDPTYRPLVKYKDVVFRLEAFFRMLKWRELARAQSFPESYKFEGTNTEIVKMIGNAVPPALARAVVKAAVSQNPNIGFYEDAFPERMLLAS